MLAAWCRQVKESAKLKQDVAAVKMQAASDTVRWREEVSLKQAHVDMLVAGDRGKEAEFMTQRVKDLQVSNFIQAWLPASVRFAKQQCTDESATVASPVDQHKHTSLNFADIVNLYCIGWVSIGVMC